MKLILEKLSFIKAATQKGSVVKGLVWGSFLFFFLKGLLWLAIFYGISKSFIN
jgi:hypothetical protein